MGASMLPNIYKVCCIALITLFFNPLSVQPAAAASVELRTGGGDIGNPSDSTQGTYQQNDLNILFHFSPDVDFFIGAEFVESQNAETRPNIAYTFRYTASSLGGRYKFYQTRRWNLYVAQTYLTGQVHFRAHLKENLT